MILNLKSLISHTLRTSLTITEDTTLVGTSDTTNFIPIHALFIQEGFMKDNKLLGIKYFAFKDYNTYYRAGKTTMVDFNKGLTASLFHVMTVGFDETKLTAKRGLLYSSLDGIVMQLCINTKYLIDSFNAGDFNVDNFLSNFPSEHCILLVDRKILEPKYKKISKGIKIILSSFETYNIDILYTTNIQDKVYNSGILLDNFRTLEERKEFLKTGVFKTVFKDE